MASIDKITIDVKVEISSETIRNCANILKMDEKIADGDIVTVIDSRNNYTGYHVIRKVKELKNGKYEVVLERLGDLS